MKQCGDAELGELGLAPPPRPAVPRGLDKLPVQQRLQAVQVRAGGVYRPHGGGGRVAKSPCSGHMLPNEVADGNAPFASKLLDNEAGLPTPPPSRGHTRHTCTAHGALRCAARGR